MWSPDGRRLAFVKTFGEASAPAYDVFVVGSDGSSETRLTTATLEPVVPTLQLRDARTGALAARVSYPGAGRAVALSSSLAVVLVRDQGTYRVLLYGARHGDPLGSVAVPSTADDLSMAGRRIVFRTGRGIWLLTRGRNARRA